MPRETWLKGYVPMVKRETMSVADVDPEDGKPRYGMDGGIRTKELDVTVLAFVDQLGDFVGCRITDEARAEIARLLVEQGPLPEEERQAILSALTGGIVVPRITVEEQARPLPGAA